MDYNDTIDVYQCARTCRVPVSRIIEMAEQGDIPGAHRDERGRWRFTLWNLLQWTTSAPPPRLPR